MTSEPSNPRSPLVSIICRTLGRPELGKALASAAGQTHAPLEIILVDAAARGEEAYRDVCAGRPVVFAIPESPLSRPRAANFGLNRAQGEYLLLLDEDDWLAPDHVESLLECLAGQEQARAAYSSTRKTDIAGEATLEIFQQPFDRQLLMRDNYIPIHSMLFARGLVDEGCRFDEKFDIFEDWDFWLQLCEHTDFYHLDRCSAFYRSGGASQTADLDDNLQRFDPDHVLGKARSAIYDKWLKRWHGGQLNQLLGAGQREWEQCVKRAGELGRELELLAQAKQKAEQQVTELFRQRETLHQEREALHQERERLQQECKRLQQEREKLRQERERLHQERGRLHQERETLHRERETLHRELKGLQQKQKELGLELADARNAHVRMEMRLNAVIQDLQVTNVNLHGMVNELRCNLDDIFSSRSWKMTRPYRAFGEWIKSRFAQPPTEPEIEPEQSRPAANKSPVPEAAQFSEPLKRQEPLHHKELANRTEPTNFKAIFDQQANTELEAFFTDGGKLTVPKAESPVLSVLLVFYNQAHLSLLCLRALLEHADVPFELIVVDNASSDRTGDLLDRLDNVKLIRNSENLGFVKAVNQGAELAEAEFLLLLNNDAFIEPGALGAALAVLREDPGAGAVGGRIELLDGKLQEAGNIVWRDGSCAGYGRGADPEDGAFRFRRETDYCSGAFLMFGTARFRDLGGFDEAFAPAYYEESDFCLRLRQQGLRIIYQPRARVRHYEFASTGGINAAAALQEKNRALFREKHARYLESRPKADPARIVHARTSNDYPNLLLIDDAVPHTSLGGGYPRCRSIITLLSRMPLNVSFFPLHFPNDNWEEVYRTLPENVEVLLNRGRSGLADLLTERTGFYRHVMISRPTNMAFFNGVLGTLSKAARQFNIIYDAEAVFAGREIIWRELQGECIGDDEKKRIISGELALSDDASAVITVSEAEAELFREHGRDQVVVLGHGLEPAPDPAPFDSRRGLLFVGALKDEHSPNVDSLLWFVCNALPLIERDIPEVELLVAGIAAAPSLVSIERSNIHMKGRLESLDAVYRDCRVFIAPTRFAAGIPHKVHEAAANGVPAVVTPLLARQLGWRHEQEVLVGEDPESFARQCVRLHSDADLWQRLSSGGREAVARDCSEERFRQTLEQVFRFENQD